jgi:hypothetical protein
MRILPVKEKRLSLEFDPATAIVIPMFRGTAENICSIFFILCFDSAKCVPTKNPAYNQQLIEAKNQ